jgi:hypothetical protein
LTVTACESVLAQADKTSTLRGMIIEVNKTKGGAKGRYVISALEKKIAETELAGYGHEDVLPILRKLWGHKNHYVQSN